MKTKTVYLIVLSIALGLVLLLIIDNLTNASITSFLANYDIFTTLAILPIGYLAYTLIPAYLIYTGYGLVPGIIAATVIIGGLSTIVYIIYKNSTQSIKNFIVKIFIPVLLINLCYSLFAFTSSAIIDLRNKDNLQQIGNAISKYNIDNKETTNYKWKVKDREKRNDLTPLVPNYLKFIPEPYGKTSLYYLPGHQSTDYICISYKSILLNDSYCFEYTTKEFGKDP